MITYELSKKLKEAGFPQKECSYAYYRAKNWIKDESLTPFLRSKEAMLEPDDSYVQVPNHLHNEDFAELASVPTLSELIEACGEGFGCLLKAKLKAKEYYLAYAMHTIDYDGVGGDGYIIDRPYSNGLGLHGKGLTPREAVAHLWLKLQGK